MRELSRQVDVILVVGAKNSSNSNRLREIGDEAGIPSYLIADGSELQPEWVEDAQVVGMTAGASAPEVLVEDVIDGVAPHWVRSKFRRCPAGKRTSSSGCPANWRRVEALAT